MTRLDRATPLLLPQMGIDRRDTLLTLAFHGEHRPVYDGIAQSGATDAFTVAGGRMLLDRGCVGSRHARGLEAARREAGDQKALAVQPGCRPLLLLVDPWEELQTSWSFVAEKIHSQSFFIAHRTVLTAKTLSNALRHAGLAQVSVKRIARFDRWAVAGRQIPRDERLASLLTAIFSS